MRMSLAIVIAVLMGGPAAAAPERPHPSAIADARVSTVAAPAATVVDEFHSALRRGDTKQALSFLADKALIFESGGVERSKAEYASHHLAADADFSQAVHAKVTRRSGEATGNVAWITSEGRTTGTWKGKAVDVMTTETMVLRRAGPGWKIIHIHWSSAAAGK